MGPKHVLREARLQLRRYRHRLSDDVRRSIEADIEKLAAARAERRKDDARKLAKMLLKKVRAHTPKTLWHKTLEMVESLAIAVIVALAIRHFVVEPFKIPTGSMEPTLHGSSRPGENPGHIGDFIMVNKFAYGAKIPFTDRRLWVVKPKRWDIIVFKTNGIMSEDGTKPAAADPPRNFVKRIVGLPGETLEIRKGWLYVDGKKADMPDYLEERLIANKATEPCRYPDAPYEPAPGPDRLHGYVKGLYRISIFGFRPFAPYRKEQVVVGPWRYGREGEPFTVPEDHYFVMGDNSPASADSRAWGFVPFENIKGRVICVWYPIRKWRIVK
jgi:signal peptidase I